MKLRSRRMKWADWMSRVAGLLHCEHGIHQSYIRPTDTWKNLWRTNHTPDHAARKLAEKLFLKSP